MELVEDKIGHWISILLGLFVPMMFLVYKVAREFTGVSDMAAGFKFITALLPELGALLAVSLGIASIVYYVIPNWGLTWLGEELVSHAALDDSVKQHLSST